MSWYLCWSFLCKLFVCVKGKSEAEIQTDTDDFLPPLRRLSPPPPANSHANTACSDTLTEAGYARCGNENQPTVLSWILLPDLPHLLDGTVCHACTQADDIIFVMSHAQIYIEWRITYLIVNLRMQHNRDYALSLYACVARSASCEWLIISLCKYRKRSILSGKAIKQTTEFHEFLREWERPLFQAWERARWKRRETRVVSV